MLTMFRKNRSANRRRRGVGLLELSMGLVIMAVVAAAALRLYNTASNNQKTTDAIQELGIIQQAVRALYSGAPDYSTGDMGSILAGSSQLPSKWVNTGKTALVNGFGQIVVVTANINEFSISMAGLPNEVCSKMATQDLGNGVISVALNGGSDIPSRAATPTEAVAGCARNNLNNVVWTFF